MSVELPSVLVEPLLESMVPLLVVVANRGSS